MVKYKILIFIALIKFLKNIHFVRIRKFMYSLSMVRGYEWEEGRVCGLRKRVSVRVNGRECEDSGWVWKAKKRNCGEGRVTPLRVKYDSVYSRANGRPDRGASSSVLLQWFFVPFWWYSGLYIVSSTRKKKKKNIVRNQYNWEQRKLKMLGSLFICLFSWSFINKKQKQR